MTITLQQFQQYLEKNKGKEIPGEHFTFELHPPKEGADIFPYTIHFTSPNWSEENVSSIGPENIEYYLGIFNDDNNAPASKYRNRKGQGSESKNARYLVKLLKELVKQNS